MRRVVLLPRARLLVAFVLCAGPTAFAQTPRGGAALGHVMEVANLASPPRLDDFDRQVPASPAANPFRVRLKIENAGNAQWRVIVADGSGATLETIAPSAFVDATYWTDEFPPGSVQVHLEGADAATDIRVVAVAIELNIAQEKGWVGNDDSKGITDPVTPARAKKAAGPVARLKFMTSADGASCSGFLVGRDLLLTNFHCVNADDTRASTRVEFGANGPGAAVTAFRVAKIEALKEELDYSLLRLSGDASAFGRFYVGAPVIAAAPLVVIQHPDGKLKKASFPPNCAVGGVDVPGVSGLRVDFSHTCDTLGGSSGSPVLNWMNSSVVGLHHWNLLEGVSGSLNQAVHIQAIVKDLQRLARAGKLPPAVVDEVVRLAPQENP